MKQKKIEKSNDIATTKQTEWQKMFDDNYRIKS